MAKKEEKQSKEEQVGFHKGSLSTLAKERQEMLRILGIIEQLMQMHIGALKELGVDIQKEAEDIVGAGEKKSESVMKRKIQKLRSKFFCSSSPNLFFFNNIKYTRY